MQQEGEQVDDSKPGQQSTVEEDLHEISDGVARITLDRPLRRGAIAREQRLRVPDLIDDASVRLYARVGPLIGPRKAKELLFFRQTIRAAEAARIGLMNRMIAKPEVESTLHEWASDVAALPTRTISLCKSLVNRSLNVDRYDPLEIETFLQDMGMSTANASEGVAVSTQSRPSSFVGW